MGGSRRQFTEQFKREAVALSYSSGKTVKQIAEELGISKSALQRWRSEQDKFGERAFPGKGNPTQGTSAEEELKRLKRELAIVTEERDILKKAMAIFSKTPK